MFIHSLISTAVLFTILVVFLLINSSHELISQKINRKIVNLIKLMKIKQISTICQLSSSMDNKDVQLSAISKWKAEQEVKSKLKLKENQVKKVPKTTVVQKKSLQPDPKPSALSNTLPHTNDNEPTIIKQSSTRLFKPIKKSKIIFANDLYQQLTSYLSTLDSVNKDPVMIELYLIDSSYTPIERKLLSIDYKQIHNQYLLSLFRNVPDANNYIFASFQKYYEWIQSHQTLLQKLKRIDDNNTNRISIYDELIEFLILFVNIAYAENHIVPAIKCMDRLLIDRIAKSNHFLIGRIAKDIHEAYDQMKSNTDKKPKKLINELLNEIPISNHTKSFNRGSYSIEPSTSPMDLIINKFCQILSNQITTAMKNTTKPSKTTQSQSDIVLSISDVNLIIKLLGKYKLINEIFVILSSIRKLTNLNGIRILDCNIPRKKQIQLLLPNDETYEYLANAMIQNVNEDDNAVSMKELPKPNKLIPEILFAGRSNVGKSSLVNFLTNRKNVAPASATPGFTKKFHFISVNKNSTVLPHLYFVDVPGLGYAETVNNSIESWRSLLERYVTVRDSLSTVFHLMDSRLEITDTDKQLIEILTRAAKQRINEGLPLFHYIVVLTKVDQLYKLSNKYDVLKDILISINTETKPLRDLLQSASESVSVPDSLVIRQKSMNDDGQPVVLSSMISKIGRDDIWQLLRKIYQKKNVLIE